MKTSPILIVTLLVSSLLTGCLSSESSDKLANLASSLIPQNQSNDRGTLDPNFSNNSSNSEVTNQEFSSEQNSENWNMVNPNPDSTTFGNNNNVASEENNSFPEISLVPLEPTSENTPLALQGEPEENWHNTNPNLLVPFSPDEDSDDSKSTNTDVQKVPEPTIGFFSLIVAGLATYSLKKTKS